MEDYDRFCRGKVPLGAGNRISGLLKNDELPPVDDGRSKGEIRILKLRRGYETYSSVSYEDIAEKAKKGSVEFEDMLNKYKTIRHNGKASIENSLLEFESSMREHEEIVAEMAKDYLLRLASANN